MVGLFCFAVPRVGTLCTGVINAFNAIGQGSTPTRIVNVRGAAGKVWMDSNLAASCKATTFTDYQANGCLYQWGPGNDGHASIAWLTARVGLAINATTVTFSARDSPGNALFITYTASCYDWHSTKNDALWQGLAGINNPSCPSPTLYRLPARA